MSNKTMSLDIMCKSVILSPLSSKHIYVTPEDFDYGEVLDGIGMPEAIDHFGSTAILDFIGEDEIKKYLGI